MAMDPDQSSERGVGLPGPATTNRGRDGKYNGTDQLRLHRRGIFKIPQSES